MPTIYASTTDNDMNSGTATTWSLSRGATTGSLGDASGVSETFAVGANMFSGRGATTYRVYRSFFEFDTSSITQTLSSATLKIYFDNDSGNANVIAIRSDAFGGGALASDDFNNVAFTTPYSAEVNTTSNGVASITLNATALADIKDNDDFIFALVNYDYDYSNTAPTTAQNYVAVHFADTSTTSNKPQIDYTVAGYSNDVISVAASNVGKVNGVATASIEKVIGV